MAADVTTSTGGFEIGSASYDATPLIARSVVLGTPVIVISMVCSDLS